MRLPEAQFRQAVAALPLVSVDWCLTDPAGRLLLGLRTNRPARGAWFTPGASIQKNEPLAEALRRVARDELGAPESSLGDWPARARLMGAWDHFYDDSAFDAAASTHYVNLPHWLALSSDEIAALRLPVGDQHAEWRWMSAAETAGDSRVHAYVRPYVDWIARAAGVPARAVRSTERAGMHR